MATYNGITIEKGMGATHTIISDSYPYTIQDFKVSKTGRITIFVTADSYEWAPKKGIEEKFPEFGEYKFTSHPGAGLPVKLWTKEAENWGIGCRAFYCNPYL